MVENHSLNSHEQLRSKSWSELPLDLLSLVFERLGFADFQRGKSVCSSWYSASRQSVPKNQIPWLILFPDQNNNNNCCMLFNPEEKDKLYQTHDLGLDFSKSVCLATYGSWLLMRDPLFNLYILNLFSHEMIDLPPLQLLLGNRKWSNGTGIRHPVFWIDEKTKDYVVTWGFERGCLVYSKKGDNMWKQIPGTSHCIDLVYKDHKLYFLSFSGCVKIFDFSGEIPRETFQFGLRMYICEPVHLLLPRLTEWYVSAIKLVLTVTGDLLKVEKLIRPRSRKWFFRIYKVYSSGLCKKPQEIDSLGDEALLFDLGITVRVNGLEGVKRNSIYFNKSHENNPNEISLFNLETQKLEQLHAFDCSSIQLSTARLFLPSFTQTTD